MKRENRIPGREQNVRGRQFKDKARGRERNRETREAEHIPDRQTSRDAQFSLEAQK